MPGLPPPFGGYGEGSCTMPTGGVRSIPEKPTTAIAVLRSDVATRREILRSGAAGLACLAAGMVGRAVAAPPSSKASALYIAPKPVGKRDGSDWENAGGLPQLPAFIAKAGPGGRVFLRADEGPYQTKALTITSGGEPDAPVTVL